MTLANIDSGIVTGRNVPGRLPAEKRQKSAVLRERRAAGGNHSARRRRRRSLIPSNSSSNSSPVQTPAKSAAQNSDRRRRAAPRTRGARPSSLLVFSLPRLLLSWLMLSNTGRRRRRLHRWQSPIHSTKRRTYCTHSRLAGQHGDEAGACRQRLPAPHGSSDRDTRDRRMSGSGVNFGWRTTVSIRIPETDEALSVISIRL